MMAFRINKILGRREHIFFYESTVLMFWRDSKALCNLWAKSISWKQCRDSFWERRAKAQRVNLGTALTLRRSQLWQMQSALNRNKGRHSVSNLSRTNLCNVKPSEVSLYSISSIKNQVVFYFRAEKHTYFSLKFDILTLNCRKKWVGVMEHQNCGSHGCTCFELDISSLSLFSDNTAWFSFCKQTQSLWEREQITKQIGQIILSFFQFHRVVTREQRIPSALSRGRKPTALLCDLSREWASADDTGSVNPLHTHVPSLPSQVRYGISLKKIDSIFTEDETRVPSMEMLR